MMLRNRAETETKNFTRLREESNPHVIYYKQIKTSILYCYFFIINPT